jgi:hypothetical protein
LEYRRAAVECLRLFVDGGFAQFADTLEAVQKLKEKARALESELCRADGVVRGLVGVMQGNWLRWRGDFQDREA